MADHDSRCAKDCISIEQARRAKTGRLKNWKTCAALEVAMKKKTLLLLLLLVVLALEGCATIRGLGEDIQNLGRVLRRAASE